MSQARLRLPKDQMTGFFGQFPAKFGKGYDTFLLPKIFQNWLIFGQTERDKTQTAQRLKIVGPEHHY